MPAPHDSLQPAVRSRRLSEALHHDLDGWLAGKSPGRHHLPGGPEPPPLRLSPYHRYPLPQLRPRVARPATGRRQSPLPRLARRYL